MGNAERTAGYSAQSGLIPNQQFLADALLQGVLIHVVAPAHIEHRHAAGHKHVDMTTNPRLFRDYITDDLRWSSDYLHSKGKYCLTHTDGENKGLVEEYVKAHVDIADSVCPKPMTSLSLADHRAAFQGKICIWGGIAAISVLEDSMSDYEFEKYVNETLEQCGDGRKLILGVADSVPPAAKWARIEYLNRKIREFGPVR